MKEKQPCESLKIRRAVFLLSLYVFLRNQIMLFC